MYWGWFISLRQLEIIMIFSQFAMVKVMLTTPEQNPGVRKASKSRNKTYYTLSAVQQDVNTIPSGY